MVNFKLKVYESL